MPTATIRQITANLKKLPAEKLAAVYDFVNFLAKKEKAKAQRVSDVVLLTPEEYEQLLRYKRLAIFDEFTRELGQEIEKRGLTEEQLMAELEETKREVFEEQYGRR
jgi:hypothetical protein